jgi:transcriptional regulator with XRE-family HTH domain
MSPEQIKSLRGLYKLSQTQFCEVSKLGEATLSRWERGIVIQNNAYDNYLYLLGFRENMDRLQQRQGQNILPMLSTIDQINSSFREIEVTEDLIRKQEEFELQPYLNARG